jgi:hypothetical protein
MEIINSRCDEHFKSRKKSLEITKAHEYLHLYHV